MPNSQVPAPDGFTDFGLSEALLKGIREAGFVTPSPIQKLAIPVIASGKDLIAQAQTGTGKTAAFGLPVMNRLKNNNSVEALVITPTRELCAQVSDEIYKLGRFANVRSVAVYGGQSSYRQVDMISRGGQIVVATPGRLLDLLSSKRIKNFTPSVVILDEADEMLDMGFLDDIKAIFEFLPKQRQTLMFSATMPPPIKALANQILRQPAYINLTATETFKTDVEQFFYVIEERERCDAITRLIDSEEPSKALVFCRTKIETEELGSILAGRGVVAKCLHGDMEQRARNIAIGAFKRGEIDILVATDVAARGLDVSDVSHVFNYHMPFDQESYVHRIGRTGRAGKKGKAITLVTPFEFRKLRRIQSAIKASFVHGEIPSVADVHKRHDAKLIAAICKQPMRDGAVDILSALSEEMDVGEAACKLISMMVDRRSVRGPEKIGFTGEKLDRLVKNDHPRHEQRGNFQPKRKWFKGKKPFHRH
jgi:ATP-dependent RNA helicase DeaD